MEHKPALSPSGKIKPSRTDTFELTISGLLTKRSQMFNEAKRLRERLAELSNDVTALDRVLATFGYDGDLDAIMPQEKPGRMFHNGELVRRCLDEIRRSGPVTAREIARTIIEARGEDAGDRRYLLAVTESVSRCLRKERDRGHVKAKQGAGNALLWEAVAHRPDSHVGSQPSRGTIGVEGYGP